MKRKAKMTSSEIKSLLTTKYSPPAYAFFTEVAKSGVGSFNGYIDGVAFALYPSMNHEIHGFEIKVSRQDFLREFEKPEKSDNAMQWCNRWWLVAPKGICDKNELPKNWGYLEVASTANRLYKKKQAPLLEAGFNLSFIAGLLRRSTEGTIPLSTLWNEVEKQKIEIKVGFQKEIDEAKWQLKKYKDRVAEFEEASGLSVLESYKDGKELGEAVKAILYNKVGFDYEIEQLEHELQNLRSINKSVKSRFQNGA
jgi:hypothetical protein